MKTITITALCSSILWVSSAHAKTFHSEMDPSGAKMCFDAAGNKAALSQCQESAKLVRDPSGAPMCMLGDVMVGLDECESSLSSTLEPVQLAALPDADAAAVASKFVASIENNDIRSFAKLIHPRGLHHGEKKLRANALRKVALTLGLSNVVGMDPGAKWNIRTEGRWFSIFRGGDSGNKSVAYFERYRGKWHLVQIARVKFQPTASL